jgi:ankyrin repeat protein
MGYNNLYCLCFQYLFVVKLGSDVLITISTYRQDTALHIASRAGQAKVVDLLLSLGAKITNNLEEKGFFDFAIENRQSSVAQMAVKHARYWI